MRFRGRLIGSRTYTYSPSTNPTVRVLIFVPFALRRAPYPPRVPAASSSSHPPSLPPASRLSFPSHVCAISLRAARCRVAGITKSGIRR